MVKVILHLAKAAIAAITALLVFSCGSNLPDVDGSGNVVKQTRPAQEEFTEIEASQNLEIIVEMGAVRSVTVEADDNLHGHIKTEIKKGVLKISADADIRNATAQKVIVTLPELKKAEAFASAVIKTNNVLTGKKIELSASSGGSMDIKLDIEDAIIEAGSGSTIKVSGKTESLEAEAENGGTIDARDLIALSVNAEASTGGTTHVNPVEDLSAEASGGGKVYYVTTPNKIDKKTSSGGNVSQK